MSLTPLSHRAAIVERSLAQEGYEPLLICSIAINAFLLSLERLPNDLTRQIELEAVYDLVGDELLGLAAQTAGRR